MDIKNFTTKVLKMNVSTFEYKTKIIKKFILCY